MTSFNQRNRHLLSAASALAIAVTAPAAAQADEPVEFDIPAQELSAALIEFSRQSSITVIAPSETTNGLNSAPVAGELEPQEALEQLLRDSGLKTEELSSGAITITFASLDQKALEPRPLSTGASLGDERTPGPFRVAQADQGDDVREIEQTMLGDDEEARQDVIIVTGSNIRGIAPESSPTLTFDRDAITRSGAATIEDFMQTLPQNFGGGSNADLPVGDPTNSSGSANSGTLGSSVNLRGLGSGSTLVLLNGRRIAPTSSIGDFVDVSMIPVSAVERVDVLTDGASAIYGGDAVAGVVNFVLRDDFEGIETSFRAGTVTDGDLEEYRLSITGGQTWDTGNALLVYEYFDRSALGAEDRSFSEAALLPNTLIPSQERHSALASVNQELSESLDVFADFTFSRREPSRASTNSSGTSILESQSDNLNVTVGGAWNVGADWFLDLATTYSSVEADSEVISDFPSAIERESTVWSADAIASGTVFSTPGGDVKVALGAHYRTEDFSTFDTIDNEINVESDRDVTAFFGEVQIPIVGEANAVPGVRRFEVNLSGRVEDYSDFGSTSNPKIGLLWSPAEDLNLRGSYSTSFNPPPLGRVGATDRLVSVLPTSILNAIFGLTPADPSIADVVSITVAGTDSNLDAETSESITFGFDYEKDWGESSIQVSSTYYSIEFENRLGATPIPDGRIAFDAVNIAFATPELLPAGTVDFNPTPSLINSLVDNADLLFLNGFDPLDAEVINFAGVVRNLARTEVSGVDLSVVYSRDVEFGRVNAGLSANHTIEFEQQSATTTPLISVLDTLYNPLDWRLRGTVGFQAGEFTGNAYLNYSDGYAVDNSPGATSIDSWATVDLNLAYSPKGTADSILEDTTFRLTVQNLFDEDPPETPSNPTFLLFGYDPTNASPLNRFVALEIQKRF